MIRIPVEMMNIGELIEFIDHVPGLPAMVASVTNGKAKTADPGSCVTTVLSGQCARYSTEAVDARHTGSATLGLLRRCSAYRP
jgi:hypothetical protein